MKDNLIEGLYDELLSIQKNTSINDEELVSKIDDVDPAEFSSYATEYIQKLLKIVLEDISEGKRVEKGLEICNALIQNISQQTNSFDSTNYATDKLLLSLVKKGNPKFDSGKDESLHPGIPLSQSALLVNARDEFRIGSELKKEIKSADRIDLICSFIKWSGLRLIKEELKERIEKGVEVRVITTVYMGASDKRAIDELQEMGAKVKVSYDTRRTRLHAKAWLFHRASGYSTAYVGSSNLSASAQTDGLEWNVRLSKAESPHLIEKFEASFESYWNSEEFRAYEQKEEEQKKLSQALSHETPSNFDITFFDIKPYSFQKEILEKLELERDVKERHKNLVVAATGTGKTVISAFDFKNYAKQFEEMPTLLFVAHRKEILQQSLQTFRQVLKDANFGELLVDNYRPTEWKHVFASIQSLHAQDFDFEPSKYDVIIIDEFHHAEADTYQKLLDHTDPNYLLGLTATPERSDGNNVMDWFGGKASAELRVWDAIEKGLLAPFQYFGVHDNTDLRDVGWSRGTYNTNELERKYTSGDERLSYILKEINEKVTEPTQMKALGFCVSVQHAEYMAAKFNEIGLSSIALSGKSNRKIRRNAVSQLRKQEINVIFIVDLFNEGIDIPEVDTILFLRPTDSSTLFTQQLGRGLRLAEDKECLTVLDFIGHSNESFNYASKFQALTNLHGRKLIRHAKNKFPVLPTGCAIDLDKVSQEIVLNNIKQSVSKSKPKLQSLFERVLKPDSLIEFLNKTELLLEDLYKNDFYFSQLKRRAGVIDTVQTEEEKSFGRAIMRSIHIDSIDRLNWSSRFFSNESVSEINSLNKIENKYLKMWAAGFGDSEDITNLDSLLQRFWAYPNLRQEYTQLMSLLLDKVSHKPIPWKNEFNIPLEIHCKYSRDEIMAAFEDIKNGKLYQPREGVYFNKSTRCNVFFITLNKSEKDYSPSTMYKDYAISEKLFHWQSQSSTKPSTKKGQRHIKHQEKGIVPLLFVRNLKKDERGETEPYFFVGPVQLKSWKGAQPMDIVWKVEEPLPADIYKKSAINFN
jgi:superfamily II DNA or RNA helicase